MSTTAPASERPTSFYEPREGLLDVDWLLQSKKDIESCTKGNGRTRQDAEPKQPPPGQTQDKVTNSTTKGVATPDRAHIAQPEPTRNGTSSHASNAPTNTSPAQRPTTPRSHSSDEPKVHLRSPSANMQKKDGRRSSWIASLGHKLSGGSNTTKTEAQQNTKSPRHEFTNPFDGKSAKKEGKEDKHVAQGGDEPQVVVPQSPRRPSVLVAAGTETKLDQPGFLSALRRLSSGNAATLGKGAGSGAACPRKIMNVDHNRERVKIKDFDQNRLRRVAFCVDVEIAGVAAHAEDYHPYTEPVGNLPKSHGTPTGASSEETKDVKSAKLKEKGEGAALKNPETVSQEKEIYGKTVVDAAVEVKEANEKHASLPGNAEDANITQTAPTTTRKKEKKKRSEAERRERKERKRRQAEQNGLVPLEIMREDDDSDTTLSTTPPGADTPRRTEDQPTTDPLRIYKRCCQLRETTALSIVKEQIVKPAATLAEAPGTVAVIDLSGTKLNLQDVVTLGDWLAVVPVRKLILDNCELGDEAVRVVLAGLLGCKTTAQARHNRKLVKASTGKPGKELMGFIEKLSLKNNPSITSIGWKHIALFIHMSRSLIAIDLTGIPYPQPRTPALNPINGGAIDNADTGSLVARAIADRMGDKLEEMILTNCSLSTANIAELIDSVIKCKVRRLGLAANNLAGEGLDHVVRYVTSGICEGLDLGGNDLHNTGKFLSEALDANNPLFALSLSDCNLEPKDLSTILPRFTALQNFKFIDLSRNQGLFSGSSNAVAMLRKYMPKMPALKRIHLAGVNMQMEHIIALAEMFPDCPSLCHINLLENEPLVLAMNSSSAEQQEEATAFLASLMAAVRVSHRIVAIEIEVPSSDSSEVVRALSSQIVAYSLRNMERSALMDDMGVTQPSADMPDKDAPEVLLHLVGHMEGYSENHDADEPAPDEDYMIASTGIAKALGVCLRNQDISRMGSRNITPTASGTATPRQSGVLRPTPQKRPKDVSRELCEVARKIRMRLRPALVKEDRAGNQENYYRLAQLDATLQRIIQRFEDEYPDYKVDSPEDSKLPPMSPGDSPDISRVNSIASGHAKNADGSFHNPDEGYSSLRLSRTPSNTSLASRALTSEEGRMHRFGQSMRRELLKPTGTDDYAHGTSVHDEPEAEHLAALRQKLEKLEGEEIRARVEADGADQVIRQLGLTAAELKAFRQDDPKNFELFKESQLAADLNAGWVVNGS